MQDRSHPGLVRTSFRRSIFLSRHSARPSHGTNLTQAFFSEITDVQFSRSVDLTLTLEPFAIDEAGLDQASAVGLKTVAASSRFPAQKRYLGNGMNDVPKSWRSLLDEVNREIEQIRRLVICDKARQAMQERLIELGVRDGSLPEDAERREIEEALRKLWTIEQALRKGSK